MKKIITITCLSLILGCASHKKTNKLTSKIICDKNFFFAYDKQSDLIKFDYNGPHVGNSTFPDYKRTFIKSVSELNKDTEMKLEYVESPLFPSINSVYSKVRIEKTSWTFNVFSAVLEVDLQYEMADGKKMYLTGTNKVYVVGTKKGSLFKALKNGHYQFIYSTCSP